MRKLILPMALLAMGRTTGRAVAVDCVRLAKDYQHRVELADADMAKNESRLVKQLEGNSKSTATVRTAIDEWKAAKGRYARMAAYDTLVASYRNTMPGAIDATNPLERKFMDDAAGAMNRREVAQKQYEEEAGPYEAYLASWRGKIAQIFSPVVLQDAEKSQ